MGQPILIEAEQFVTSLLQERSPAVNFYHSLSHTQEVVKAIKEIAHGENVSDDDLELLTISAWFHDVGYTQKVSGHEEISAMFASGFLIEHGYDSKKIDIVIGCILATKVPQKPENYLQEIMCDADLHHLGNVYFEERNNLYRMELEQRGKKKISEYEWLVNTIDFVTHHNYFTKYAKNNYLTIKAANVKFLQEQLDKIT